MESDLVQDKVEFDKLKNRVLTLILEHKCSSVKELAAKSKIDIDRLRDILAELESENKIELYDTFTFFDYISSIRAVPLWFVLGTIFITLTSIYLIPEESQFSIIRAVLGSIFVFLPGYSISKALFTRELSNIMLIALSIGISLVLIPLEILFLDYMGSIDLNSIVLVSSIISIAAISISVYRSIISGKQYG